MKYLILIITLLANNLLFSQVGINTTDPKAQLDIKASNQVTPTNTDGVLIPRIDVFPVTNPTADQNGMLVFLTTDNKFYFWKNTTTTWVVISDATNNVEKINDLIDGKSDNGSSLFLGVDAGLFDDETGNKNVGIGFESLKNNTTGNGNVANGYQALHLNTTGYNNVAIGMFSLYSNTTGSGNVALGMSSLEANSTGSFNSANGNLSLFSNTTGTSNVAIGNTSLFSNETGYNNVAIGESAGINNRTGHLNVFLGNSSGYHETGSNKLYIENTNANSSNALIYGEFGTGNTTTGNILRTNSEFQIGDPSTTGYKFPTARGIANQVLQTNATGVLSWQNGSSLGAQEINDLTDGIYDGSSLFLGTGTGIADDGNNNNVAIGLNALNDNISGQSNTVLGNSALLVNTTGNNNVAIGNYALHEFNAGNNNTAIGSNAGGENTGSNNIFLGYAAGFEEAGSNKLYIHNTYGDENDALIYGEFDNNILRTNSEFQIGDPSTTGYKFPTARGVVNQILQTNATGVLSWQDGSNLGTQKIDDLSDGKSDNDGTNDGSSVFLGVNAGLNDDQSDNKNVGIGFESLKNNTTGQINVAIGYSSLKDNTIGWNNTAIGVDSMRKNTTGSYNTVVGLASLGQNKTSNSNTGIGYAVLSQNLTGNRNTANGIGTLSENTSGSENTSCGASSLGINTSGSYNTSVGSYSLMQNTTGNKNVAVGFKALNDNETGIKNVAIGYYAGLNETGSNKLYIENSEADADNALIYGEFNSNKLRVNGKLEFGQTGNANYLEIANLGSNKLGLNGDLIPYNNVSFDIGKNTATEHWDEVVANTFVTFSDKRTKNNISSLSFGLNEIMLLNPVSYQYKKIISANNRTRFGLIAQEVEKVIPQVVINEDVDIDPKTGKIIRKKGEYKALSYTELIPVLIKATQEQQEIIKNNKTENKFLKEKIISLEKRLLKIEKALNK